jgi:hypothetical protein
MRALFLTIFLASCMTTEAQVDAFHKDIIDMMMIKGEQISGSLAFHDVFPKLKRNFKSNNIAPEVWQEMKGDEAKQVATYMDQAAYAYRQFFDLDDIQNMTEFYLTEAGQAYAFGEDLSVKQKGELAQFLASDTGESWAAHKTEVEEDLAQTRRDWSAQVFKEKMKTLIKQGHLN